MYLIALQYTVLFLFQKEADTLAYKAETSKTKDMHTMLAKSNALRRKIMDKKEELGQVEAKIIKLNKELKKK